VGGRDENPVLNVGLPVSIVNRSEKHNATIDRKDLFSALAASSSNRAARTSSTSRSAHVIWKEEVVFNIHSPRSFASMMYISSSFGFRREREGGGDRPSRKGCQERERLGEVSSASAQENGPL
jgi:hypothetical protein